MHQPPKLLTIKALLSDKNFEKARKATQIKSCSSDKGVKLYKQNSQFSFIYLLLLLISNLLELDVILKTFSVKNHE